MPKDKFYQTILENAFDGVHIIDNQGLILYVSPNGANILGYTPEEALGKNSLDFVWHKDKPTILHAYQHFIQTQQTSLTLEAHFLHRSGKLLYIEARAYNLLQNPEIQGIVINFRDISERKLAEANQAEILANIRAILDNTQHTFFLIDVSGKVLHYNQIAEDMAWHKLGKKLYVGMSFDECLAESKQAQGIEAWQRSIAGEVVSYEAEIEYPNGEKYCYEVLYSPIKNQDKVWAVAFSSIDISERKFIERKLHESEKLYRVIAENSPKSSINILDQELNILFTEGQVYDYLSINPEDFIGKNISDFFPPHIIEYFKSHLLPSFAGEVQVFEYKNRLGYFLATSLPLPNEAGIIDRILLIFQDISDLKANEKELQTLNNQLLAQTAKLSQQKNELTEANLKLIEQQEYLAKLFQELQILNQQLTIRNQELFFKEEELASANEELISQQDDLKIINEQLLNHQAELEITLQELSDRNFELDQIVYRTSHDIRSPLASVLGLINVMKLEGIPTVLEDYVHRIETSIQKLERFANSMLDFAKVSRSDKKSDVIDFEEVIEKFWEDFRYLPNFDKIQRQVEIKKFDDLPFASDLFRIEIIFRNLISNAIKYANPMQELSFLKIQIMIQNRIAEIEIQDNGIGIKQEYLDKVFDMFFRATEKSEGTGLGLYIVKQTVDKLNGTIHIQSTFGEGTHIQLSLPSYQS
ncbi:MAG: PAS domain-containing sensor histidine kinase [Microscillaceae bacterium]|jgi:PAS domain S-box-containing protein|nr:PAS domain-containing sensor histidine kinase [Microscillaceae bacterium]